MPPGCLEIVLQIGFIHARIYRKHRIQRGHDTCSVQAVSVDWATRCRHRNPWVVDEVIWLNYIVTTDIRIVCNVVIEVVELTDNALLGRIRKGLRKSAVSVLGGFLLTEFPQLTLFPRVSETLKPHGRHAVHRSSPPRSLASSLMPAMSYSLPVSWPSIPTSSDSAC